MVRRWIRTLLLSRQQRLTQAVLRASQERLLLLGVPAAQAEAWTVEFVSYLQTPIPSCQAMWRWVCRAHGTRDWPQRIHWVAAEASRGATLPASAVNQAAATAELP